MGKYYVSVLCEESDPQAFPIIKEAVGIDLGIKTYMTLSDREEVENPKYLNAELRRLAHEQKALSRKKKGSHNYEKQRIKAARNHEHISPPRRSK